MQTFWTDYGTTDTTKNTFGFWLFDESTAQGDSSPTFAVGDVRLQHDNGVFGNTTNLPVHVEGGWWKQTLTQAELQAKVIVVKFADQSSPKQWLDTSITIFTGGGVSAWFTT